MSDQRFTVEVEIPTIRKVYVTASSKMEARAKAKNPAEWDDSDAGNVHEAVDRIRVVGPVRDGWQ